MPRLKRGAHLSDSLRGETPPRAPYHASCRSRLSRF
jgi:hypothetical protein